MAAEGRFGRTTKDLVALSAQANSVLPSGHQSAAAAACMRHKARMARQARPTGGLPGAGGGGARVAPPAQHSTTTTREKRWADGTVYVGAFGADGLPSGDGKTIWPDGSVYTGAHSEGQPHGRGMCTFMPSGDVYEGEWRAGQRHGLGVQRYAQGEKWEGSWEGGRKHGRGVRTLGTGQREEGEWERGERVPWAQQPGMLNAVLAKAAAGKMQGGFSDTTRAVRMSASMGGTSGQLQVQDIVELTPLDDSPPQLSARRNEQSMRTMVQQHANARDFPGRLRQQQQGRMSMPEVPPERLPEAAPGAALYATQAAVNMRAKGNRRVQIQPAEGE